MGTDGREPDTGLEKDLFDGAYHFEFFQAVKLLEHLYPERSPVAESRDPRREVVRFRSRVRFDFPAGAVDRLDSGSPPELWVNHIGLAGQFGPLPQVYSEQVLDRISKKDFAMRDFLDIFNHRLISIWVRIRKKYRLGLSFQTPDETPFANYLFALMGLGNGKLRNRQAVADQIYLGYTGLIRQPSHSMVGLEMMLGDYFGVAVKGEQFVGQWIQREPDQWTYLVANCENRGLGIDSILGTKVWDQGGKFRLTIGPMELESYQRFLPGSDWFRELKDMTRLYVGRLLDFDVNLELAAEFLPGALVSDSPAAARLGWTSWLEAGALTGSPEAANISPEYETPKIAAYRMRSEKDNRRRTAME